MLNTTTNGIFVPDYVAIRYGKFVTDAEFKLLLVLGSIPEDGNKAINIAAQHLGYKTSAPVTKMLTTLADRKVIVFENGSVDATPLWLACRESVTEVELPAEKETKSSNNQHYTLAATLGPKESLHARAQAIKKFLKKYSSDQIELAYSLTTDLENKIARTKEIYLVELMLGLLEELTEAQIIQYVTDCHNIRVKSAKNGMVWLPTTQQLSAKVNIDKWRSKKLTKRNLMTLAD